MNKNQKWQVERESCQSCVVTDGVAEFRCGEEEANWLCRVLNERDKMLDERKSTRNTRGANKRIECTMQIAREVKCSRPAIAKLGDGFCCYSHAPIGSEFIEGIPEEEKGAIIYLWGRDNHAK